MLLFNIIRFDGNSGFFFSQFEKLRRVLLGRLPGSGLVLSLVTIDRAGAPILDIFHFIFHFIIRVMDAFVFNLFTLPRHRLFCNPHFCHFCHSMERFILTRSITRTKNGEAEEVLEQAEAPGENLPEPNLAAPPKTRRRSRKKANVGLETTGIPNEEPDASLTRQNLMNASETGKERTDTVNERVDTLPKGQHILNASETGEEFMETKIEKPNPALISADEDVSSSVVTLVPANASDVTPSEDKDDAPMEGIQLLLDPLAATALAVPVNFNAAPSLLEAATREVSSTLDVGPSFREAAFDNGATASSAAPSLQEAVEVTAIQTGSPRAQDAGSLVPSLHSEALPVSTSNAVFNNSPTTTISSLSTSAVITQPLLSPSIPVEVRMPSLPIQVDISTDTTLPPTSTTNLPSVEGHAESRTEPPVVTPTIEDVKVHDL